MMLKGIRSELGWQFLRKEQYVSWWSALSEERKLAIVITAYGALLTLLCVNERRAGPYGEKTMTGQRFRQ